MAIGVSTPQGGAFPPHLIITSKTLSGAKGKLAPMKESASLNAQQINQGQSEIWLESGGKELTQRRKLATNEVVNVTRRRCTPEVFQAFYADYHIAVGHVATLAVPNLDEIAAELGLRLKA